MKYNSEIQTAIERLEVIRDLRLKKGISSESDDRDLQDLCNSIERLHSKLFQIDGHDVALNKSEHR